MSSLQGGTALRGEILGGACACRLGPHVGSQGHTQPVLSCSEPGSGAVRCSGTAARCTFLGKGLHATATGGHGAARAQMDAEQGRWEWVRVGGMQGQSRTERLAPEAGSHKPTLGQAGTVSSSSLWVTPLCNTPAQP